MTISNPNGYSMTYSVRDTSGKFNETGQINANSFVVLQPRGVAPFTVTWTSITLQNVPSPAIVSFWNGGGGYSR
jgi:hypothetical protein